MFKRFFKKVGSAIKKAATTVVNAAKKAVTTVVNLQNKVLNTVLINPILKPALKFWKEHDPYVFPALSKGLQAVQKFSYANRKWLFPVVVTVVVLVALSAGYVGVVGSGGSFSTGFAETFTVMSRSSKLNNFLCLFCKPTSAPAATSAPTLIPTFTFIPTKTSTPTFTPTFTPTPTATATNTPLPVRPTKKQSGGGSSSDGGGGAGPTCGAVGLPECTPAP